MLREQRREASIGKRISWKGHSAVGGSSGREGGRESGIRNRSSLRDLGGWGCPRYPAMNRGAIAELCLRHGVDRGHVQMPKQSAICNGFVSWAVPPFRLGLGRRERHPRTPGWRPGLHSVAPLGRRSADPRSFPSRGRVGYRCSGRFVHREEPPSFPSRRGGRDLQPWQGGKAVGLRQQTRRVAPTSLFVGGFPWT